MGSRISINLNELVGNPRVKISIESEQHKVLPGDTTYINSTAQVTFLHDAASKNVYTFDLVSGTDKHMQSCVTSKATTCNRAAGICQAGAV